MGWIEISANQLVEAEAGKAPKREEVEDSKDCLESEGMRGLELPSLARAPL